MALTPPEDDPVEFHRLGRLLQNLRVPHPHHSGAVGNTVFNSAWTVASAGMTGFQSLATAVWGRSFDDFGGTRRSRRLPVTLYAINIPVMKFSS